MAGRNITGIGVDVYPGVTNPTQSVGGSDFRLWRSRARQAPADFGYRQGVDRALIDDLRTVVAEACANVVEDAFAEGEHAAIEMRATLSRCESRRAHQLTQAGEPFPAADRANSRSRPTISRTLWTAGAVL